MRLIRLLKGDLRKEIGDWVQRKIISEDQARAICQTYGLDYDSKGSSAAGTLTGLGYLFLALSVLTLIGFNWEDIPRALRTGGLIALTLGVYGLAIRTWMLDRVRGAIPLFLFGNMLYGLSIILIAQIYQLGEYMPDGIFWWALGSMPFGPLLNSPILALFSLLLALIWLVMEYTLNVFAWQMPLFLLAAAAVLVRAPTSLVLALTWITALGFWLLTLMSWIWADASGRLVTQEGHLLVSVSMFVLVYALSCRLRLLDSVSAKDYAAFLSVWTLRFALLTLLIFSLQWPWFELLESDAWYGPPNILPSMWVTIGILLGGALLLIWRTGAQWSIQALVVAVLVPMVAVVYWPDGDTEQIQRIAQGFQLLDNLAVIVAGTGLILYGTHTGVSHYYFLGVLSILVLAMMRYVALFGDNYIGAALLFLALAVVLLGAARYWKRYSHRLQVEQS